jgi:hypothetical protein
MFRSNVIGGLFLLARGRAAGIAAFGNSVDALYASLAPLIAFPLVLCGLLAADGAPAAAGIAFLSQVCAVLFVSVATHAFAVWTRRETLWLRTATALNWSVWMVLPVAFAAGFIGALLVLAGMSKPAAVHVMMLASAGYLLWYHWFLVRCGLNVKLLTALGIVLATNAVILLLAAGPDLIDQLLARS